MTHRLDRIVVLLVFVFILNAASACMAGGEIQVNAPPTPTADPYAVCPTPTEGASLYINADQGYCLLYPSDFSMSADNNRPSDVLTFTSPTLPPAEGSMEIASVYLRFEFNGPAGQLTSRTYAEKWIQFNYAVEGYTLQDSTTGGQASAVLDGVPGMYRGKGLFVVANETRYVLIMFPMPGDVPALDEMVNRGWNTITGSLAFFPPQAPVTATLSEDVCPVETADGKLYVNEVEGYCYLYPSDFVPDPNFSGAFMGGPLLAHDPDFGDIYTKINVGTYGYFPGQTPRQVIASWMDQIDPTSLYDLSIGGFQAVAFVDIRQPWNDRTAMISVNGDIYSLLAQPYEPNRWPDGIPYLDRAWDMVVNSLRFFDPWR